MKKIIAALLALVLILTGFNMDVSAASVKLNKKKKTIYVGDTFKMKLKGTKSGAKITWKSSDDSIATVNDAGKVTAVKKGKATITATYKKKDYKCAITVKDKNPLSSTKQGDIITFGKYEQDNDPDNGKEPIEWIVLSSDGKELFVLSKYALDCIPYNIKNEKVTWENCTLRKWLNDDFYNAVFSKSEMSMIKTTEVKNDDNPVVGTEYGSEGGNDTKDQIFVLSMNEATNTSYGFNSDYRKEDIYRRCSATKYAKAQGVQSYDQIATGSQWKEYTTAEGEPTCYWWLRTPGLTSFTVTGGDIAGGIHSYGYQVYDKIFAVRPAMVLNIE